jgi:hypothetical protein
VKNIFLNRAAVLCLWPLLIPGVLQAQTEYLRQDEINFRLDEREYKTTLPLDPSREYRVDLRSDYTFRPVLDFGRKCYTRHETSGRFFTKVVPVVECRTDMPFLVNGNLIPTHAYRTAELAAYWIKIYTHAHFVPKLELRLWGTGKPLTLQSTADFSDAVPSATAAVNDEAYELDQMRQAAARVKEQERQEKIRIAIKIGGGLLVVAIAIGLWCAVAEHSAPVREKRRVARLTREIHDELARIEKIRRTL